MIERLLRAFALLIVVVAIIDPTVTSTRRSKPEIAVVAADSLVDGALAASVARELASSFTVVTAPLASASGTVVVGTQLPAFAAELARPVFAVIPETQAPSVAIEDVAASATVPLATRVPVAVNMRVSHANGQSVRVALQLGDLVVDQVVRRVDVDRGRIRVPLSFVPVATGLTSLRVTASVTGTADVRFADLAMDVRDARWPVLFYDTRPSWMSTFVRRVIERDARFVVTSRVLTSRGASREAGSAPASLDDAAIRSLFNVIVVGAPELLTDRDMAALEQFMRQRGGSVVLLFDQRATTRSERLTAVSAWNGATISKPIRLAAIGGDSLRDSTSLSATDWMFPVTLPESAEPLLVSAPGQRDATGHAAVWQLPVGAGRLVTSGALDSWKYRDPGQSGFESFWLRLLADAAESSAPPVAGQLSSTAVSPGEAMSLAMTVRDIALAPHAGGATSTASVSASLWSALTSARTSSSATPSSSTASTVTSSAAASQSAGDDARLMQSTLRLWPIEATGHVRADFRAPLAPGSYHVRLTADGNVEEVPFEVRDGAAHTTPPDRDLVVNWALATGGRLLSVASGRQLSNAIAQRITPEPRRVTWHPMRSPWWLPLFCLPLCIEWWLRRRRGLA